MLLEKNRRDGRQRIERRLVSHGATLQRGGGPDAIRLTASSAPPAREDLMNEACQAALGCTFQRPPPST